MNAVLAIPGACQRFRAQDKFLLAKEIVAKASLRHRSHLYGRDKLAKVCACAHVDVVETAADDWRLGRATVEQICLAITSLGDLGRALLGGKS